jgi:tetratricopeptide (TPR) repeat protein
MDGLSAPSHSNVHSSDRPLTREEVCPVTGVESAEGQNLVQTGRLAEGRAKLASALEALARADAPDTRHACLMNAIGSVELQQRRTDLAIEWFQRALAVNPLPDAFRARLKSNLAGAYGYLKQLDRAEGLARQAIELYDRALGRDHPETWLPQLTLASVHAARGEYARAEPVFRRVLYLAETSGGAASYDVAQAAGNLAFVYMVQAKYSLARELFEKSLAVLENNPMRLNGEIPLTQANLAFSCAAGGRRQEAQLWLERALAQAQRELSAEDDLWLDLFENIAGTRLLLKDYESGRQMFDRALTLIETRYGPGAPQVQAALERYRAQLRRARDETGARVLESRRKAFAQAH